MTSALLMRFILCPAAAEGQGFSCFLVFPGPPLYNPRGMVERKTILVVETGRLGDLVMVTPALETLRSGRPDARIVVAGSWPLAILAHHPAVDDLVEVPYPNPRWLRLAIERRRWGRWLGRQNACAVLLCHGHDHRVWQWAARRAGVQRVLSERLSQPVGGHHSERLHRLALEIVGGTGPAPPVRLFLAADERAAARRRLAALGRDPGRLLVGVHVGVGRLSRTRRTVSRKMWPLERWARLVPDLVGRWGAQILFTGVAAEAPEVAKVAAMLPDGAAINLAGRTDLRELAAAVAECDLLITPDTGLMHVAAALDVPLVAVFSVTSASEVGPRGPGGRHTIVASEAPCLPCPRSLQKHCPRSLCTDDLTVDRVRQAVEEWLGRLPPR